MDAEDRRSEDVAIAEAIRKINYDCTHPHAVMLIEQLAAYGTGTLINMWRDGRLFSTCRIYRLPPSNSWLAIAPAFLEQVAVDTALIFVGSTLRRWRPDGGASIGTFYVNACRYECKKQYEADHKQRRRDPMLVEPGARELTDVPAVDDPARQVVYRLMIAEAMSVAEAAKVAEIVRMMADGATHKEIAKALRMSVRTVERRMAEYRQAILKMKNGWFDGSGAE